MQPVVPVVLLPVDHMSEALTVRQHVTARWGDGEEGEFDAVVEKRDGALQVVGLTPLGTVAFSVRHDAEGVHFENRSGRDVPFPPDHIVADVQRAFYPWFDQPAVCNACERSTEVLGMRVSERFEAGRLRVRSFFPLHQPSLPPLTVRFSSWRGELPFEVRIENPWHGYELSVQLLE